MRADPALLVVGSLLLALGGIACGEANGQRLDVSVAVSLEPAVREALGRYTTSRGYPEVRLSTGASGVLLQQIRRGAPADLLISASPFEIDRLVEEGLARPETRLSIASNRLVVIVPVGTERPPRAVGDLARPELGRIAMANPRTAPLGRYSRETLDAAGIWALLEPRLVLSENARTVVDYVARGEVDAGLVYRTDAALSADRVALAFEIPSRLHAPISYESVVLERSSSADAARELAGWLAGPAGREVLARHGFLPPEP